MGNCLGSNDDELRLTGNNENDVDEVSTQTNGQSNTNPNKNVIFRLLKFKRRTKHLEFTMLDKIITTNGPSYERFSKPKNTITEDIQLQCLNAHTLLKAMRDRETTIRHESLHSSYSSCLDLEWEHEGNNDQQWTQKLESIKRTDFSSDDDVQSFNSSISKPHHIKTNKSHLIKSIKNHSIRSRTSSRSSRTSTPESMEWDCNCGYTNNSYLKSQDSLDIETLDLLEQIELLKNKALAETGSVLVTANTKDYIHQNSN